MEMAQKVLSFGVKYKKEREGRNTQTLPSKNANFQITGPEK